MEAAGAIEELIACTRSLSAKETPYVGCEVSGTRNRIVHITRKAKKSEISNAEGADSEKTEVLRSTDGKVMGEDASKNK